MALSIGLLGSLHCVGMCGPIALSLPLDRSSQWSKFSGNLIYSSGRLAAYFSMGLLFGLLGSGFELMGLQQYLSITIGVLIILGVITHSNLFKFPLPAFYQKFIRNLQSQLGKAFERKSNANLLGIGFINGFLPCGLVYMAIAGAINSTNALSGGLFMLSFGLGTLPLMWLVALYGNKIHSLFNLNIKRYLPFFLLILGVLFILRGANLGIPYLSPLLVEDTQTLNCH